MQLDLLVLKFEGSHSAAHALAELRAASPAYPWLAEVAVVERHRSGRVSLGGTYAGYYGQSEEGADTAGGATFGALTGSLLGLIGGPAGFVLGLVGGGLAGGSLGKAVEDEATYGFYDRVKAELSKDSSALLLLASGPTIEEMVAAFASHDTSETREQLTSEEVSELQRLAS